MRKVFFAVVALALCPFLSSQQVLNNKTLLKLLDAGVAHNEIVELLNSTPGEFDTSSDALSALRGAGADDRLIEALISRVQTPVRSLATPISESERTVAIVHFYRYKQMQGSALNPSVYCDGIRVARIANGRYLDVSIPTGSHTFFAEDRQAGAVVNLEAGKEYFFRTDLQVGFWKGHFRLDMVQPDQGKYDLSKLKPLVEDRFILRFTAIQKNP